MKTYDEYTIKGNHPIFKRIDQIAIGRNAMLLQMDELLEAGYEVTIEKRPKKDAEGASADDGYEKTKKLLAIGTLEDPPNP